MMKNGLKKHIVWLICLTLISEFGFSQIDYNAYLKPPVALPTSPDAASIEKFGNIPVSYATGVPDISIPIWNIKCGELSWGISLSYHSSGFKVDESASGAGLGWSLMAPGVITRAVVGRPDEENSGEPYYPTVTWTSYDYLYNVWRGLGNQDSELDIFSFNFNGRSGKFVVNQDGTIFQIPYSNLKIANTGFNVFTITDENGLNYVFDQKESTTDNINPLTFTSAWYLSKVYLPTLKDSLIFTYAAAGNTTQVYTNFVQAIGSKYVENDPACSGISLVAFNDLSSKTSNTTIGTLKLTGINFPNGSVVINYSGTARQDLLGTVTGQISNIIINRQSTQIKKLSFFQSYFYNNPGGGATDPSQYRLRLDSVFEYGDISSNPPKAYRFEYNTTPIAPRGNYGQDTWGFNNGHTTNVNLIQTQSTTLNSIPYTVGNSNRTVDTTLMQACMLTAINYPTGGKTTFKFEPNRYDPQQTLITTGTQGVTAFGDGTQAASVTFVYPTGGFNARVVADMTAYNFPGVTQQSYIVINDLTTGTQVYRQNQLTPNSPVHSDNTVTLTVGHTIQLQAFVFTTISNGSLRAAITVNYSINTNTPIISYGGGLRIKEIKSYSGSGLLASYSAYEYDTAITLTPTYNILKTSNDVYYRLGYCPSAFTGGCSYMPSPLCRVFNSGSVYPMTTAMGSPMLYRHVRKLDIDSLNATNNGKSEFIYDVFQDQNYPLTGPTINVPLLSNEWKNGFLSSETHYKLKNGQYSVLKKTENTYVELKDSQTYSLKVNGYFIQTGCLVIHNDATVSQDINWVPYPIYRGSKKLLETKETLFDDLGNSIVTITDKQYGSTFHDYVTKSSFTDSKGNLKSTTFQYPQDLSVAGNVYQKMATINLVAPVVQQQSFNVNTLLSTVKTNYRDWNNDSKVLAPEFIQASTLSNALENRIQYTAYDSFTNVLSVAKSNDIIHSFIWDYKHSLPIAEVSNAAQADIAATSFEAESKGNWSFTGTPVTDATSPTGGLCYNLSSGAITKTGLTSTNSYIVSYWIKSTVTPLTITGTVAGYPVKGKTIGAWTYFEHKVTGQTSITVGGAQSIDELRLYPSNAQMTTSTYIPLVGKTTSCDADNRITYYVYDAFQRLKWIKDQDGNIIKTIQYHYVTGQSPL